MIAGLRTDRLIFEAIGPNDAAFLLELHNSEPWQRNIGDRGLRTLEDAADYIRDSYLPLYELGLGPYKLVLDNGHVVGTCGLYRRENLDYPDIGYALLPEYFKKGYALEATKAFLVKLEEEGIFECILAITLPGNQSSVALLQKLGFRLEGPFYLKDDPEELSLYAKSMRA